MLGMHMQGDAMARDGSRGFERISEYAEARALRARRDRLSQMQAETARVLEASRRPSLLPEIPLASIGAADMAKIIESLYDVARVQRFVAERAATRIDELPRLICKRTATVIGFCSPQQWDMMQAAWPALTLEQAEAMLAATGPIAPQALFRQPQALQVLAGLDPLGAAVNALDVAIDAGMSGIEKIAVRDALAASIAEGEEPASDETPLHEALTGYVENKLEGDDSLALIVLELAQDLLRMNAEWYKDATIAKYASAIFAARYDIADLIESLKDACHVVARKLVGTIKPSERLADLQVRLITLCEKHGAAYMRRTAPLTGEVDVARRIIGAYYKEFAHVFAKMTDADLLLITGNGWQFEQTAQAAMWRGNRNLPTQVAKRLKEYQKAKAERDLFAMVRGIQIDALDIDESGMNESLTEKPLSGIERLKLARAAKAATTKQGEP